MHGIRHHLRAIWRRLGVHWPTDVLVGGAVGTARAMGIWGMACCLQQCSEIEQDDCTGQRCRACSPTCKDSGAPCLWTVQGLLIADAASSCFCR
jgi:hypothetical protein